MRDGSTVTQQMTPSRTPLAMTTPMSRPKVKLMKQRAMKPAMVVREEPVTEVMVAAMAWAMASFLSAMVSRCSL